MMRQRASLRYAFCASIRRLRSFCGKGKAALAMGLPHPTLPFQRGGRNKGMSLTKRRQKGNAALAIKPCARKVAFRCAPQFADTSAYGGKVNVQGAKMKALKIPAQRKTSRSQPKGCRGGVLLPITAKIFAFAKRFAGNRYQSLAQAGLPCAARLNLPTLRLGGKIEFARAKICKPLKSRKERKRGSVSPQGVPCPSCLSPSRNLSEPLLGEIRELFHCFKTALLTSFTSFATLSFTRMSSAILSRA